MNSDGNCFARHRILAFVVLAFALSWWTWPMVLLNPDSVPMVSIGPLVAAVLVITLADGPAALLPLMRSLIRWRVPWPTWLVGAVGPFALAALTAMVAVATGIIAPEDLQSALDWSTWATVPLLILTTGLLGGPLFEEIGWRGFLLPNLQLRYPALWSTAVVGSLWMIWHLPLLISEPTGQRPPLPFAVWVLAQAVVLTWLYNATGGSVLVPIVFHTAVNTAARLLLQPILGESGYLGVWWLMAAVYVLAAAAVVWITHGRLGIDAWRSRGVDETSRPEGRVRRLSHH